MKTRKFFWGASTSSHQVEGGTVNQWSVWELANAANLAKSGHKRYGKLPNWEEIKSEAANPANYVSGTGVEHYQRYKEDFEILEKLGLNAFRFSIEWARLEPEEGRWDLSAFNHYKEYITELNRRGIEPFLNIWHWTIPVWFSNKGGFAKQANLKYFDNFVKKISEELLDGVKYVITLNEPNVYMGMSYSDGMWPPQERNKFKAIWVYYNLTLAHKRAWRILKHKNRTIKIGIAQQLANIQAYRPGSVTDELVVKVMRYFWNWWFLNRIKRYQDFVGFNYYYSDYYKGLKRVPLKTPLNDVGHYMQPDGILPLLQRISVHYPDKPIIVTENGLADAKDKYRKWWLHETMQSIETAKSQGIPIIGYLHWSLLDNFEWADGWWPKFGLVEVDLSTMKRTLRPSAIWWSEEIKHLEQKDE